MGTVAFTGYRPEKLPFKESDSDVLYLNFRKKLNSIIKRLCELGNTDFISGMAQGFDTWVAEEILDLKEENPKVTLECAIPFPEQASAWSYKERQRRQRIIESADKVVITSTQYSKSVFFIRNRYMVEKADVVVCCYDGKKGGTSYTVDYARKLGKLIIQINPTDMVVSVAK